MLPRVAAELVAEAAGRSDRSDAVTGRTGRQRPAHRLDRAAAARAVDLPAIEALVKRPGRAVTDARSTGREEARGARGLRARLRSWLIRADKLGDVTSPA